MKRDDKKILVWTLLVSFYVILAILISSCSKSTIEIDNGNDIKIEFVNGLNDVNEFKLSMDDNGYYFLTLEDIGQTTQRITARLSRNNKPLYTISDNNTHKINWQSNLFWYYNGEVVITINENSYTKENGYVNTVIAPIPNMRGDTMKIVVSYNHIITRTENNDNFFDIMGTRIIKDSVQIILK